MAGHDAGSEPLSFRQGTAITCPRHSQLYEFSSTSLARQRSCSWTVHLAGDASESDYETDEDTERDAPPAATVAPARGADGETGAQPATAASAKPPANGRAPPGRRCACCCAAPAARPMSLSLPSRRPVDSVVSACPCRTVSWLPGCVGKLGRAPCFVTCSRTSVCVCPRDTLSAESPPHAVHGAPVQ